MRILFRRYFSNKPIYIMANEQFNNVKDFIVYKVINHDRNKELLSTVPYVNYLDLAIVFYRIIPETVDSKEKKAVLITNAQAKLWETTPSELMIAASGNTQRIMGVKIRGIFSTIKEYMGDFSLFEISKKEESEIPLYVVSNSISYYGAAVLLYKDLLKAIAAKLKSDIYIIPCSIHEIIVVKSIKGCEIDTASLREMIDHVNRTNIPEDEVLSSNLYYYSKDTNVLSYAN